MNRKKSGKVKLATLFLCAKALVSMTKTTDGTMTKSRYYIMAENRSKIDIFLIAKKYEVILKENQLAQPT